jgi:hypothetical protein
LRHGFAAAGEAGEHVFELGELDLELTLARASVAGKDVEDELRAIENAARESGLKVAQLRGREVVIEENEIGVGGGGYGCDLFNFAGANEGGGIGSRAALKDFGNNLTASAQDQFAKFGEGLFGVEAGRVKTGQIGARRNPHTVGRRGEIRLRRGISLVRRTRRRAGIEAITRCCPALCPRTDFEIHSHEDGALRHAIAAAEVCRCGL